MNAAALLFLFASADQLYKQGVQAFESGNHETAIAALKEAASLSPRDAQIWKVLGVVHASRGGHELANEPFEQACRLNPDLVDACYFHGRNLYALNRFEPAIEVLRKALPRDRQPWRIRLGIAQALEALGRAAEAEKDFLIALQLHSRIPAQQRSQPDFDPNLHFGIFLYRQGRLQDAIPYVRATIAGRPRSPRAHFELGRLLYHTGRLQESAAELEKSVEQGHGTAAGLLLANVYRQLGRHEDASRLLESVTAP